MYLPAATIASESAMGPCVLTGLTAPFFLQSTSDGTNRNSLLSLRFLMLWLSFTLTIS